MCSSGFLARFRPEVIIVSISLLYIAIGGFMNSALNNPADDINTFIRESLKNQHHVILTANQAAWIWSTVVFTFMVGSFIGSVSAHSLADRFGRKPTLMYFSSSLYLLAAILFYLARPMGHFGFLIAGRLLTGISNGIANPIVATYLVESVPEDLTGFAGSVIDFSGCIGSFLGIFLSIDALLGSPNRWHHLLGAPCVVMGAVQIFTSVLFRESPKYTLLHKHAPVAAVEAVGFFHGPRIPRSELWKIVARFADAERDMGIHGEYLRDDHEHVKFKKSRFQRHYKTLLLSCILGFLPLVCGYTVMLNYSAEILQMSGFPESTAQTYTSVMGGFEVFGSIGSLLLNYRSPRRTVLLSCSFISLLLMTTLVVLLALNSYFPSIIFLHASGVVILLVASITVIGPFPLYLLLPAELAPQKIRAMATSFASGAYYLLSITALLIFYPLFSRIGAYSLIPFITLGLIILPYLYFCLPETSPRFAGPPPSMPAALTRTFSSAFVPRSPDSGYGPEPETPTSRMRMRSESAPLLNDQNARGRRNLEDISEYQSIASSSRSTSSTGINIDV